MIETASLFRLLGDGARLRILRLVDAERLNVTELTAILGIAQSGVSRHLGLLKDAGLVEERRDGGFTFFRLAPSLESGANGFGPVWPLLRAQFDAANETAEGRADAARLEEVRRLRKENFDEHGAQAERRQIVPGRSWAAWARALGDRSDAVLARAKEAAGRRRVKNVEWKRGELEKLPLKDGSVDVALLSQALHHAASPAKALAEAVRIVRSGGRVLVLELRRHEEQWVRDRLGDKWLGFADDELKRLLHGAGLTNIKVSIGARRARDPFTVLIASGGKTAQGSTTKATKVTKITKSMHNGR